MVKLESLKKSYQFKKILKEKKVHSEFFSIFAAKNFYKPKYKEDLMSLKQEYGVKELGKLPGLDRARDNTHDGPISNEAFANIIYKNIRKK